MHFCTKIGKKAVYLQPITFAKTCATSDGFSCARLLGLSFFLSGANIISNFETRINSGKVLSNFKQLG